MSKKKMAAAVADTVVPAAGGIVNVIFRGLFIYVQRRHKLTKRSYVEVVMPNVGEEHVYKAGGFLQQSTLGPSMYPYGLTNVEGGKGEFNKDRNIILRKMSLAPNLTPAHVYATFVLPQPFQILSLGTTTPIVAAVDPLDLFNGRKMSSVQIFRYRSSDLSQVRLFPHRVQATPHQTDKGSFLNIHICNDEDFEQTDGHTGFAIDRMFDLIPCLNCKVRLAYWEIPHEEIDLASLGLLPDEILNSRDLHQRTLNTFARGLRSGHFTVAPPQGCVGTVMEEN